MWKLGPGTRTEELDLGWETLQPEAPCKEANSPGTMPPLPCKAREHPKTKSAARLIPAQLSSKAVGVELLFT